MRNDETTQTIQKQDKPITTQNKTIQNNTNQDNTIQDKTKTTTPKYNSNTRQ